MAGRLPSGQLHTEVVEMAADIDAVLAGPCPVPDVFPPGLRRLFRLGWAGLRAVRRSYRPGTIGFLLQDGERIRGAFLPAEEVRAFLQEDAPPTVGALLDEPQTPGSLIVVLRARRACAAFSLTALGSGGREVARA